ncbi:MAG: hypothetical protein R8K22_00670 [Mariprofundaceae bacterium]
MHLSSWVRPDQDAVMIRLAYAANESGLPQFENEHYISEVFWLAIAFFTLLTLFKVFILPVVQRILDKRAEQIRQDLERAAQLKHESEAILKHYEQKLKAADQEVGLMLESSNNAIVAHRKQVIKDLEKEVQRKKSLFYSELEYAKGQALKDIRGMTIEISTLLSEKLIAKSLNQQDAEVILKKSIHELEGITRKHK